MSEHIQQLGNYRLLRLLGHGGFADVYLGSHIHLETQAAIKVLHAQLLSEGIEQFRQEARTIARLEHPHIVRILDFGVHDGIPFLVMAYAPNGTLRQRHPRGSRVPLAQVLTYVQQVASALQYAHDRRIVHRDIKPENLLIGSTQQILLSDFGIARITPDSQSLHTQEMAGTIAYMAPEQIGGRPQVASDQYALAVLTYEWLCGQRPFEGGFTEVAVKHSTMAVPALREKAPEVPPAVEEVILTALRKDPHQRFASIIAFSENLERAIRETGSRFASSELHPPLSSTPSSPLIPSLYSSSTPVDVAHSPGQNPLPAEGILTPVLSELSDRYSSYNTLLQQNRDAKTVISHSSVSAVQPTIHERPARPGLSRRAVIVGAASLVVLGSVGTGLAWLASSTSPSTTPAAKPGDTPTSLSSSPITNKSLTSYGTMFGFDPQHTRFISSERKLSPATAPQLKLYETFSTGGAIQSSPCIVNGNVYVGSSDGKLYAFNIGSGKRLWAFSTGGAIYSSPAVAKNVVYVGSQDSKVYAVDIAQGKLLWSIVTGDVVDSSPVVVAGIVYAGSHDYKLYALDAITGNGIWNPPDTRYFIDSSPAVANGTVYFGSPDTHLYAFNANTGALSWAVPTEGAINSSPAIVNGTVYIGSADGKVYAFHATTGVIQRTAQTGDAINSSPAVANGIVYIGSDDGKLYSFNAANGDLRWQTPIGKQIRSSPTVANDVVYIGSDDGKLYALHATTGDILWSAQVGSQLRSSPAVFDGFVSIGSDNGKLYVFHLPD
jgi:outer membrane protein assembly factor BamB